jgi:hypothetical protein
VVRAYVNIQMSEYYIGVCASIWVEMTARSDQCLMKEKGKEIEGKENHSNGQGQGYEKERKKGFSDSEEMGLVPVGADRYGNALEVRIKIDSVMSW